VASGLISFLAQVTLKTPYSATISPTSHTFPAAAAGYGAQTARQFTITNTGTGQITNLAATISSGASSFEISTALSPATIAPNGTATVSVRPRTGLAANANPYAGTLTVTGSNGISLPVSLSFTVNSPGTTVTGVTVAPPTASVHKGLTQTFTATVTGTNNPAQTVTWRIDGNTRSAISSTGLLTVAANETAASLTVRATSTVNTSVSGTATVTVTLDPTNNATINGQEIGLAGNASGDGWTWNAADNTLTLTGGGADLGDIAFVTDNDITIAVTGDTTANSIVNTGTGGITITSPNGNSLTLNSSDGGAISAAGDIVIDSGTVYALTRDEGASAIESTGGNVIIRGTANVTAEAAVGEGAAISAAGTITISTSGNVSATADAGLSLEASAINITNGATELTFDEANGGEAYNVEPAISGNNTTVIVNGVQIYPDVAPTITSANSTMVVRGTGGSFQVTADGTQPISYDLGGAVPNGVSINSSTGLITIAGTTAVGEHRFTITASNAAGSSLPQNFTLTVTTEPVAPSITSANSTAVASGVGGTFQVTAYGTQPISYDLGGAVPNGVSINSASGLMTIAATTADGEHRFTITAGNAAGSSLPQNFTLTVTAAPVAPSITSANRTTVAGGAGGTFQVTATGNPSTFTYSLSGTVPAGVSINGSTGLITIASTTAARVHVFTITASNGVNPDAAQRFTLTVSGDGGGGGGGCSSGFVGMTLLLAISLFMRKRL